MEMSSGTYFLRNVVLLMTHRRQAVCSHRLVSADPNRNEEVNLDDAFDWIEQAAGYRNGLIKSLLLSGEELFTCFDKARKLVDFGARRGLEVSSVSNGFWAHDPDICRQNATSSQSRCRLAQSPVILPDGRVIGCCCSLLAGSDHPLVLGNLHEEPLEDVLDRAEMNPILHTLRVWGPRKLISMIEEAGLKSELPEQYMEDSICGPCLSIVTNPKFAKWLEELAKHPVYQMTVACGRAYHLNETSMLSRLLDRSGELTRFPSGRDFLAGFQASPQVQEAQGPCAPAA